MMDLKRELEQRCFAACGHVERLLRQLKPRRISQHFKEDRVKKVANEGPRACQVGLPGTLTRAKVLLRGLCALCFMYDKGKESRRIGSQVTCISSKGPLSVVEENSATAALWVQRPNTGVLVSAALVSGQEPAGSAMGLVAMVKPRRARMTICAWSYAVVRILRSGVWSCGATKETSRRRRPAGDRVLPSGRLCWSGFPSGRK